MRHEMKESQCIDETPIIMISSEADVDTMRKASDKCGL